MSDLVHVDSVSFPYKELNDAVTVGIVDCVTDQYDFVTTAVTGLSHDGQWNDCFAVAVLKKFRTYLDEHPEYAAYHPEYASFKVPDYSGTNINRRRFSYTCAPGDFDSVSLKDILLKSNF